MVQRSPISGAELKVVVSDLHLGDGKAPVENWLLAQQAAWERLLARLDADAGARPVEMIVNGDGFDLLAAGPPLGERDTTDSATALAKIATVTAAHPDWLASLRAFLARPGRTLTFTIGNHDVELAFAAVRAHLRRTIGAPAHAVRFCLARGYRPFPDVHIEHGCQTDAWNRIPGLWDTLGERAWAGPRELETADAPGAAAAAEHLALPLGSRYYYRVFRAIQQRFPYFDAFLPTLPQAGILALLCLNAPELVVSGAPRAQTLRADPGASAAAPIPPDVAGDPARLFAAVLPDVAGLQIEVAQQAGMATGDDDMAAMLTYVLGIQEGLQSGEREALRAIFALPGGIPAMPRVAMPAEDAAAAAAIFADDTPGARVRFGLIGHTHVEGMHDLPRAATRVGTRTLINTGTWYGRLALPAPNAISAISARLARWLRAPEDGAAPLAEATAFTYALVRGGPRQRSTVELARAE